VTFTLRLIHGLGLELIPLDGFPSQDDHAEAQSRAPVSRGAAVNPRAHRWRI